MPTQSPGMFRITASMAMPACLGCKELRTGMIIQLLKRNSSEAGCQFLLAQQSARTMQCSAEYLIGRTPAMPADRTRCPQS